MRPIAPRIPGAHETTIAEDQEQYQPITVGLVGREDGAVEIISRYTFTPEERTRIAKGSDVYFSQLNYGGGMTPQRVGFREAFTADPE
jgi:hypothetical protein